MIILASLLARNGIQFFIRLMLFLSLWILVMVFRMIHRIKTRKRFDEQTKYMMEHTKKDENGKYPWEYEDSGRHVWDKKDIK